MHFCITKNLKGRYNFLTGNTQLKEFHPSIIPCYRTKVLTMLKAWLSVYTGMGRPTYVCATCSEHFTRRYSATRHNLTIHDNRGEIVPLLEYIIGRKIGRYQASLQSNYVEHVWLVVVVSMCGYKRKTLTGRIGGMCYTFCIVPLMTQNLLLNDSRCVS
jgi:hypothetical protein